MLYIAGLGRSGSTILGNILGEIEGFFHGGEFHFIWKKNFIANRLCGCWAPFDECQVWNAIIEKAFGGMDGVDAREMIRLEPFGPRTRHAPLMLFPQVRRMLASRLTEYMLRLGKLYRAVQETTGSRVIVDSSKLPSYGYVLGMMPDVDLYVVHLVRDPRAVAYSWLRKKPQPDNDKLRHLPPLNDKRRRLLLPLQQVSPVKSSLLWDAWNVSAEAFWRGSSSRYMRLGYENFMEEPRRAVEDILGMLGEDAHRLPFVGEREVELGGNHTLSGNLNRFQSGRVRLHLDDEWAHRMRLRDKTPVTLLTLPLLMRYGYPLVPSGHSRR